MFRSRSGEVFATQAECPHQGGPLADGLLGGSLLICPLHSRKFDLTTGEALSGGCKLQVYPAKVSSSGQILVELGADEPPIVATSAAKLGLAE